MNCNSCVPSSADLNVHPCSSPCAPSPGGCLLCESVPEGKIPANLSAILFGPRDRDASVALRAFLSSAGFTSEPFGPLVMVREARERLLTLGSLIRTGLSPYTQSGIHAAYSPVGVNTVDDALEVMIFAAPLSVMIDDLEHEWVRRALKQNWLFSVFHPIINAQTGEVQGNEALLRARNPQSGQLFGAGQIIQACEKLNLLHQLDQRARHCAIQAASLHVPGTSKIFINFLPNTIYDPEICLRTTMEAASTYNVPMDRLVFEVVETEKIPDMAHLCKVLDYYRERGVGTAIDDMGAGFTGSDYITSLRPNFVKLDREFVLNAEQCAVGRRAMDAIIATSHANNARVIAEGIETLAQMKLCTDSGVDFLQGFLFAKPACPPQLVNFPLPMREAA